MCAVLWGNGESVWFVGVLVACCVGCDEVFFDAPAAAGIFTLSLLGCVPL